MNNDRKAFFSESSVLDMSEYVVFDYFFESTVEPTEAAAHLCQEQSTAQWRRVGVDEDLRPLHAAKVIDLVVERCPDKPCLPFQIDRWDRLWDCRVKIAYPIRNIEASIPNLLTACCGEGAFFSPGIHAIKLHDILFPPGYLDRFEGPKFGVEGLRAWTGVYDRPLFLGVIKPNIGLAPEPFRDLAYQSWLGGLDIAKDDELLFDTAWSPFEKRTRLLGEARRQAEQKTGKRCCYLANITDEVDRLLELHDIAIGNGVDMLMINAMCTGLSAARMVRKHTAVPLVAHFDMVAPITKAPYYGIHSRVITKLQRLAGFDAIVFAGMGARMKTYRGAVLDDVRACLQSMSLRADGTLDPSTDCPIKPALPVPGGSQWAGSLKSLFEDIGTTDFAIVPGRAVFGHPDGPKAGATSLHQGWEAVTTGVSLDDYARDHQELAVAIAHNAE
ncbi:MAG: RuBisCO large subunit C-terminal-like domain-containing protein [Devosia sp.]|nr:RuBisCO large subunit C-terminal-like domain-containing protein [Devosia sp.]